MKIIISIIKVIIPAIIKISKIRNRRNNFSLFTDFGIPFGFCFW